MDANRTFKSSLVKVSIIGVFILLMLLFTQSAIAGSVEPYLQENLMNAGPDNLVPVIIRLSDQTNLAEIKDEDRNVKRAKIIEALQDKADKTQGPLWWLLMARGVAQTKKLWLVNSIAAKVPASLVNEIASFPGVQAVAVDAVVQAPPIIRTNAVASEWNISKINAPSLWNLGFMGLNVVVANVDTGVDITHPVVSGSWRGGTNSWYNPYSLPANASSCYLTNCSPCELSVSQPCDGNGHGTGTMGIMVGGVSSLTNTAIGVAPGAKWIAVKGLNDGGTGFASIIIEGYQWLLNPNGNPATADAPDIINNSWAITGCYVDNALLTAIQNLRNAEIAVVFSAGNDGPASGTSASPATYLPSFSVGSTDSSDLISTFSSRGPNACDGTSIFPNVVAPGENILFADPTSPSGYPHGYSIGSGTSFSAPHVAGAIALLKSAFPNKKVADFESALMVRAVQQPGAPHPNNTYGYGRIDVLAAYNYLLPIISVAPSSYNFANVGLSKISAVQVFNVTNNSASNITIGTVSIDGMDFSQFVKQSDTCSGQSVPPGGTCVIGVEFSPATLGNKSAILSIPSNAPGTVSIALSGVGFTPPTNPIGVFRNGNWYLDFNADFAWDGCGAPGDSTKDACIPFGMAGDIPVVGNWNGSADGKTKIGVFRNGTWYLDYPGTGTWVGCGAPFDPTKDACIPFGMAGDIPVVGNWNGSADGQSKIGVFRNGIWYLDYPGTYPATSTWLGCGAPGDPTKDACIPFGVASDIPVVGNWNGSADGKSKIGVFRNGIWYLDYPGTGTWVGCGAPGDPMKDACLTFGLPTDIPLAGRW